MLDGGQELGIVLLTHNVIQVMCGHARRLQLVEDAARIDRLMLAGIAGQEDAVVMTNSN